MTVWLQEVVQHQWDPRVESQPHLKWAMAGGAMESPVVAMLNIGKTLIPCVRVLGIIHAQDMHNHSIYDLGLAIYLRVEGCVFGELGV